MMEVLTVEEIRYWIERLMANEYWGWKRDERLLARFIGFKSSWRMRKYLWGDWHMNAKLQINISNQLHRILSGEIICQRKLGGTGEFKRVVSNAVVAEVPRPLSEVGPARAFVTVGSAGVKLTVKAGLGQARKGHAMPSFKRIWEEL